jgi:hypothetical protein
MSNLEHCFENAIAATKDGKDYVTWINEEIKRGNMKVYRRKPWIIDSTDIDVRHIWELAQYVVYTHDQYKE